MGANIILDEADLDALLKYKFRSCLTNLTIGPRHRGFDYQNELKGFEQLPDNLFDEFPSLTSLAFVGNTNLVSLPDSLGSLKNLTELSITINFFGRGNDSLVALPDSLGDLEQLTHLTIARAASLVSLPESLGKLKHLTHLTIDQNDSLVSLPDSFGKLENLRKLLIQQNLSLKVMPERIDEFANLTSVKIQANPSLSSAPDGLKSACEKEGNYCEYHLFEE